MEKNNFKKSSFFVAILTGTLIFVSTTASAGTFFRTGNIVRTLSDTGQFGGCMVQLDVAIQNGCPSSGWVSFDCAGSFGDADAGRQMYSSALVALSLAKQVTVKVDNTMKAGAYCVATRLDIR